MLRTRVRTHTRSLQQARLLLIVWTALCFGFYGVTLWSVSAIKETLPTENLLEDADGLLLPTHHLRSISRRGRSNPPVASRCGRLLPSASADVRALLMTSSPFEGSLTTTLRTI